MTIDQLTAKAELDLANVDAGADRRRVLRAYADEVLNAAAEHLCEAALRCSQTRARALFSAAVKVLALKRPA